MHGFTEQKSLLRGHILLFFPSWGSEIMSYDDELNAAPVTLSGFLTWPNVGAHRMVCTYRVIYNYTVILSVILYSSQLYKLEFSVF